MDKVEVEIIGKPLKQNDVGSIVAVTRSQAKYLIVLKRAKYHTAAVATDDAVEISPRTGQPKRVYRRRDMQAAK